jgi:hypothetical protein
MRVTRVFGAALALALVAGRSDAQVVNGSFESGLGGWIAVDIALPFLPLQAGGAGITPGFGFFVSAPTDGALAALTGFDGDGPGSISLAQDVALDAEDTLLLFDWRAAYDLTFGATQARVFRVRIEPSGGGAPLRTSVLLTALPNTTLADSGPRIGMVDLAPFSGQGVRIRFEWSVPESFTGPAFVQLDHVRTARFPILLPAGPAQVGGTLVLEGQDDRANAPFCTAFAPTAGPTSFPFFDLDLGPLGAIVVIDVGTTSMTGEFQTVVHVPAQDSLCGFTAHFQAYTVGIGGPRKTNALPLPVQAVPQSADGALVVPATGDHYTFAGTAGEAVTIEVCRLDNTGGGFSTLDPFVCLLDPSGATIASDDDSNGDCEVPGPFGASILSGVVLPADGTYTVIATSFQGSGGETGTYRVKLAGCVGPLALVLDDGPSCPPGLSATGRSKGGSPYPSPAAAR